MKHNRVVARARPLGRSRHAVATGAAVAAGIAQLALADHASAAAPVLSTLPLPTLSLPPTGVAAPAFNAAAYQRVPENLAAVGYTEQEYFISGTSSAFQYVLPSSSSELVTTFGAPAAYTNRILVRMPSNPAKFSGNVIVELLNGALVSDNTSIWPLAQSRFTANGDAWVALTTATSAEAALKQYGPNRYKALSWPTLAASCSSATQGEPGLIYEEIAELGLLLKSGNVANNPLNGYNVKATYLAGYSQSASIGLTFNRVFDQNSTLFNGILLAAGGFRFPLNSCESATAPVYRYYGPTSQVVPVMQTQTISEQEVLYEETGGAFSIPTSGADSDSATNRYRYYDIAGTTHVNGTLYNAQPETVAINAAGGITFVPSQLQSVCQDPAAGTLTAFPDHYAYDAIWTAMENWVTSGTLPPHATKLTINPYNGYPVGGWRTPSVDVPMATYFPGNLLPSSTPTATRNLCALTGYQEALSAATLAGLYPTSTTYAQKVAADAATLQSGGFLTAPDAAALEANPAAP